MNYREVTSPNIRPGRFKVGVQVQDEDGEGQIGFLSLMEGKQGRTADDLIAIGLIRSLLKRPGGTTVLVLPDDGSVHPILDSAD